MRFTGRLAFALSLPLVRLYIRHTLRSYVMIVCDDDILMVKGWFGRQQWHLPGGGIHKNEPAAMAALRELHEEVGLSLNNPNLKEIGSGHWQTDGLNHEYIIFICKISKKPPLHKRRFEIIDIDWVKPTDLNNSNSAPELRAAIKRAGLL